MARSSQTISLAFNPMVRDARELRPTLDIDMTLHLSCARRGSDPTSPVTSPLSIRELNGPEPDTHRY